MVPHQLFISLWSGAGSSLNAARVSDDPLQKCLVTRQTIHLHCLSHGHLKEGETPHHNNTTPRRFPHHCQELGLVITNTTCSVFSFQNASTLVRLCYTSRYQSGQVSKAEVVVIGKYNKDKEKERQ